MSCKSPIMDAVVGHRPARWLRSRSTSPVLSSISNLFSGPRADPKKLPGGGSSGATLAVTPPEVRFARAISMWLFGMPAIVSIVVWNR
jgi:hypothetical protein